VVNRFVGHARALVIGVANQGASWRSSGVAAEYDFEQIGRGRLTNHSLVAMSAARTGVTVVTANARDFQKAGEISPILLER